MFPHLPTPLLMSSPVDLYPAFRAHLATLTPDTVAWDQGVLPGKVRVTTAAPTGQMFGSIWRSASPAGCWQAGSSFSRAIQHAFPNEATFNAVVAAGGEVLIELVGWGNSSAYPSVNRNGYPSSEISGLEEDLGAVTGVEFLYFLPGVGARRMNLVSGTGPTVYTWS